MDHMSEVLSAGISASIAAGHAIHYKEGFRVGGGMYNGEYALSFGAHKADKTFTLTLDSAGKYSVGFGFDL